MLHLKVRCFIKSTITKSAFKAVGDLSANIQQVLPVEILQWSTVRFNPNYCFSSPACLFLQSSNNFILWLSLLAAHTSRTMFWGFVCVPPPLCSQLLRVIRGEILSLSAEYCWWLFQLGRKLLTGRRGEEGLRDFLTTEVEFPICGVFKSGIAELPKMLGLGQQCLARRKAFHDLKTAVVMELVPC